MHPARPVSTRWTVTILGVALLIGAIDGIDRLGPGVSVRPDPAYADLTRRVGPFPVPGSRLLNESAGEFHEWIDVNALGFRGPMSLYGNSDGRRRPRLLVFGDSYTAAWEVPREARFTERLASRRPRWSVTNLGMPAWGTDQEYLLLEHYPYVPSAEVVVLVMTPLNDIADNGAAILASAPPRRPHFVPASPPSSGSSGLRAVAWTPSPMSRGHFWLALHSGWYRLALGPALSLARRIDSLAGASRQEDTAATPWEAGVFAVSRRDSRWETAWMITGDLLDLIRTSARTRGAELRIVLVPHYAIVQPELTPRWVTRDSSVFDLTQAHTRIAALARQKGIAVLDLTSAFVQFWRADVSRRPLFFERDKHFTPLAHCLTAELLARWLEGADVSGGIEACR